MDYIGLDQLVGLDTIVGQDAPRQASMVRRGFYPIAAPMAPPQGPQIQPVQATRAREFPIGFPATAVAAATTVAITANPQLIFRPSRLVVPAAVGVNFNIVDLRVGKNSQFVSPNALPAAGFSETAVGVALALDTCNVGQLITITVQNTDGAAPHTFSAMLIGTSVE